jgi:uncharacterized protein (UPF0276 family)
MIQVGVNYDGRDPGFVAKVLSAADVVEVTPETFATIAQGGPHLTRAATAELRAIAAAKTLLVHGVGLSIATAEGMNEEYLHLLDTIMASVEVAWHSEHLAYTTVAGEHLGTMLVPPRTEEVLGLICDRVCRIQDRYQKPFLLEHVVDLLPDPGGAYTKAGFLNAITRQTGCGVLLDLYNLECDTHNGFGPLDDFLDELDLSTVIEIHVASGTITDDVMLDVHSRPPRTETLDLLRRVLPRTPNVRAVLFELLGPAVPVIGYDRIREELLTLRAIVRESSPLHEIPLSIRRSDVAVGGALGPHQHRLRELLKHGTHTDEYTRRAAQGVGLPLLRRTIRQWREFRLREHCPLTSRLLCEQGYLASVVDGLEQQALSPYIELLAEAFLRATAMLPDALISSTARFEQAILARSEAVIAWPCDPYPVLAALLTGAPVPTLLATPHEVCTANGHFTVRVAQDMVGNRRPPIETH